MIPCLDSSARRYIQRILSLPLFPEDIVTEIWENEIRPWLGLNNRDNRDVWSHYHSLFSGQGPVNNKFEGFHSGFKHFFNGTELQFWELLKSLTLLQPLTYVSITGSNQGKPAPATTKKVGKFTYHHVCSMQCSL